MGSGRNDMGWPSKYGGHLDKDKEVGVNKKIGRRTNFIVYVTADVMNKPADVFQAVFKHLVLKDVGVEKRKQFMAQYTKAHTDELKLKVIDSWVQVRDAATFPFIKPKGEDGNEQEGEDSGVDLGEEDSGEGEAHATDVG